MPTMCQILVVDPVTQLNFQKTLKKIVCCFTGTAHHSRDAATGFASVATRSRACCWSMEDRRRKSLFNWPYQPKHSPSEVFMLPHSSPEFPVQFPLLCIYLVWPNRDSAHWSASRGKCLNDYFDSSKTAVSIKVGLWAVLGLGLVLRLWLVSGLYNWLFYLATVRQHKHVAF